MDTGLVALLLSAVLYLVEGNVTPTSPTAAQRFQADKFLDMLGRSFDPQVAYVDLLSALHKRMRLDPPNNSSGSPIDAGLSDPNTMAEAANNCPAAPAKTGASVTYTSDRRIVGSRAFYQCETGYEGRSLFVQCINGGQWSAPSGWEGCKPVDCGAPPPSVQFAEASFTATVYKSIALYTCQPGYKIDTPNANVSCLDTGYWDTPTFKCEKVSINQLDPSGLAALGALFGGGGSAASNTNQIQQIHQLQQLATTLLGGGTTQLFRKAKHRATSSKGNVPEMLPALLSLRSILSSPKPTISKPQYLFPLHTNRDSINYQLLMAAILKSMPGFPGMGPVIPPTTTPATTTTQKPTGPSFPMGGIQLPKHLMSLLPNGISSSHGMRPQDLLTLASAGLGSASGAAAPRDITQLLGSMNPMSMFSPGMGLGGPGAAGTGAAGAGAVPPDPEKMAEQREEMMLRAMMANAMKSMMQPKVPVNGTATTPARNSNPAMDMMTLMALQSSLGGGAGSAGGAGGGFDPMAMMMGMNPAMLGLGGGGAAGGGLFGGLFGGA
ncbi:ubiquilin-like isoform X2 [Physella acuta]|uniref:ubiquilin-like isoform X2 n=1 Tax=Physella acuta TaxID=109671 RepID=UPI0027DD8A74|nr:ubiquilin-like isoform X2 [Physella acuta]